jgi:hypothetical protein
MAHRTGSADFAQHAHRLARDWWRAGQRPQELFVLTQTNGTSEFGNEGAVHLFTSPALAMEYGRVRELDRDACSISASELAVRVDVWAERGSETFVLDRCARCTAAHFVAIELLRNPEQFGQFWAFTLILQEARMRHFAVSAFRSLLGNRVHDIVPKLKELRDHVNAGCPAVHFALGLLHTLAVPDEREELLAVSKERLVELDRADLADGIGNGMEGLLRGFAVLRRMAEGDFEAFAQARARLEVGIGISQNR